MLARGIDDLAPRIWRLYHGRPGNRSGAAPHAVPAARLLSPHWDALLYYWRGAEARQEAEQFLREWQDSDPGIRELAVARAIAGR